MFIFYFWSKTMLTVSWCFIYGFFFGRKAGHLVQVILLVCHQCVCDIC